jgi:NHLM bacteriocin system ABC transporter ATP-binding protein
MSLHAQHPFASGGTAVETGSHRPFLLNDPEVMWLIDAGSVDVFAVPLRDGEPAGARTHLFRAGPGQALFGLASDAADSIGFLAVGQVDTRLRKFPVTQIQALAHDTGGRGAVAALVERWIAALYGGLSRDALPKRFTALEAGHETSLGATNAGRPVEGVVWLQPLQGSVRLVGREELPVPTNGAWLPLAPSAWVHSTDDARLHCVDTLALMEGGGLWSSLRTLSSLIIRWAGGNAAQATGAERARLAAKAQASRRALEGAVSVLSRLLRADGELSAVSAAESDPLVAAFQLVGRSLGLPAPVLAELKAPRFARDPLTKLVAAARLRARRVLLTEDWWCQDNGPLLAFLKDDNRPVALLPASAHTYELVDPAQGTRALVTVETAQALKPLAYTFYRSLPNRRLKVWDVLRFGLHGTRRDIVTIVALGLTGGLLSLLVPIATGVIFDSVIPGAEKTQLLQFTLGLLVAAFASVIFQITSDTAMLRIQTKSDASIQSAVWDRLLALPLPFFRDYTAGDLAMRAGGIGAIRAILSDAVISTVLAAVFSLFNFVLLFHYSVELALLATVLVAVSVATAVGASVLRLKYQRPIFRIQGRIAGMVLQLITGITKLRVAGAEALAYAVWARAFSEEKKLDLKTAAVWNGLNVFNTAYSLTTTILLFAAMSFWMERRMSTGDFLAFSAAFGTFLAAMLGMGGALISMLDTVPIYERAKPILETLPEINEDRADPGELLGGIELSCVTFRYKSSLPLILNDVSFQVKPGEFLAIVGPSGSGKSTLIRLLLGFEKPESGAIYYDGLDLAGLDVQAVRRQFGVVLQSGKLVPGSIYENIIGSSLLTLEDAWDAARKAGLEEDIKQMPMGMHTFLSEGAGTLSGGQRQRLMIARALVSRPRMLLFDEATSALDNRTQAIVSRSLEQLQATRLVIAHRLSTILNADRILVIQAGRLVQIGTYQELLGQAGPFAELARRQLA